jgi:hypothetical protein
MIKENDEKWFRFLLGKLYNERVRINILQALPFWVAGSLVLIF